MRKRNAVLSRLTVYVHYFTIIHLVLARVRTFAC